jgi:N-acetylglucosamine-6-phosphate deacetylase
MPSVGSSMKSFVLNGRSIKVADRKLVDEEGRLAGADLDMASAVRNAVRMLGLPLPEAVRMASANPAEFLALRDVGRIAPGQRANLVLLDDDLQVRDTWIDGVSDLKPTRAA